MKRRPFLTRQEILLGYGRSSTSMFGKSSKILPFYPAANILNCFPGVDPPPGFRPGPHIQFLRVEDIMNIDSLTAILQSTALSLNALSQLDTHRVIHTQVWRVDDSKKQHFAAIVCKQTKKMKSLPSCSTVLASWINTLLDLCRPLIFRLTTYIAWYQIFIR